MNKGVLTFFCGKMGAGKTTKSLEVAHERNAVLLSEDEWLASVYPDSIKTLEDYVKFRNESGLKAFSLRSRPLTS